MAEINTTYDITEALKAMEAELIASMMRNLEHHRAEELKEGYLWSQWQVEQLARLEEYKKLNAKKYNNTFKSINSLIDVLIKAQRDAGNAEQEIEILKAIKKGAKNKKTSETSEIAAGFFKINDRKINALINATVNDVKKGEIAILRMSNDKYRQIIYNAQIYAASGSTYKQAVDMATKDFLRAGLNCIEYKNGSRHSLSEYADMAIRTAQKRAYLTGEGEKRIEWGISTVILNKRGDNPCPKCVPFVGKVFIDDVWSGGTAKDGPYPLLSNAIERGLYHPRCRDSHTTYFPGISTPPDNEFTKEELKELEENANAEAKQQYAERQAEKYKRMSEYSLDENNKRIYKARAGEWEEKQKKYVANSLKNSKINTKEAHRKNDVNRSGFKFITDEVFNNLIIEAKKNGAVILRGTSEVEEHLDRVGAAASNIGEIILFRKDVCISEVLEETYHFKQNLYKMNDDKEEPLRTILNEIDAKQYLLDNAGRYKIPRNEIEQTKNQLEYYKKQLREYEKGDILYE